MSLDYLLKGLIISKYADWVIFDQRLEQLIRSGRVRRIPKLRTIHVKSEEWYLNPDTNEIYVYVRPDDKILPKWEKVDIFAKPEIAHSFVSGLDAIPTAKMIGPEAVSLKGVLRALVDNGIAEIIDHQISVPMVSPKHPETWYRDLQTKATYRLIENIDDGSTLWERVALNHKETAIQ